MKRIVLTICAAAAILSGCNREPNPVSPSPVAIDFGSVGTRAGLADLQANGFGVWAFVTNDMVQDFPLMSNCKVTDEDKDQVWVYSPIAYWFPDTEYSFTALYPHSDNPTNVEVENAVVKLSVAETPSETDWLVAKNYTDTKEANYATTVSLQFQHVLTSVGFNIWRDNGKHQNDQMRIKKVTLSNINKAGTLTLSSDSNTWVYTGDKLTAVVDNSANLSDTDNIGAVTVNDDGTLEAGGSKPFSPFGDMMLLPQEIESGAVTLRVEYELKRQNAADWESAELEAPLPARTWEAGRRYTYNVVLSSVTDITIYYLQTKVDQWGTPQVGGTVIIK